jgi:hypothetical protein
MSMFGGTGGDFDPHDGALRAEDARVVKAAELTRASRLPPILSGGPLGSYRGALALSLTSILLLQIVLYDLGVLWQSPLRYTVATVTDSGLTDHQNLVWVAVEGRETRIYLSRGVVPPVGFEFTATLHSRYFDEHIARLGRPGEPYGVAYVEPAHTVTVNGIFALIGTLVSGVLAVMQIRLVRRQRRDADALRVRNASG